MSKSVFFLNVFRNGQGRTSGRLFLSKAAADEAREEIERGQNEFIVQTPIFQKLTRSKSDMESFANFIISEITLFNNSKNEF